ncbi:ribonuclease H-like domain-containing protein [Tanacetum coccineum]
MWMPSILDLGENDNPKNKQKYNLEATVLKDTLYPTQKGFTKGFYDLPKSSKSFRDSLEQVYLSEDANQKFQRSLPLPCTQVSLYDERPNQETSSYSLLANQSSCPQLIMRTWKQIMKYDLKKLDFEVPVAMISNEEMNKFTRRLEESSNFECEKNLLALIKPKMCGLDKSIQKMKIMLDGYAHTQTQTQKSDIENQPVYDRFAEGMHAVPPPMTGNYTPSGPEIEIDYSQFTYGPKQTQPSESESQSSEFDTCESNISTKPSELYESESEDEYVSIPTKQQGTPSFANKQVKTPRETVKNQFTHSQKPKVDKKELGYGFTVRACFVCGSLNHLIRDCDFHEKRMARKAELNNGWNRKSSQREIRQTWNNVQRVNKQNQFVPSAVLTRTGKIPVSTARASGTKNVSTARQSFNRQTVLTSTAMKVNTVKPIVNRVRPANVFHKTHSPSSRPFKKTTVLSTNFSKQKVNTAKVNAVSAVGGKRETAVKPSAGCNWRPQRYNWHNDYPHRALKNKGIVDSGCSRHMTGNKAYLAEFQDFNGGPVAFGGSKGYITGKGKIKTSKLDFENVCFMKELQHFNLFFVSQICDKKNKVLFTDSECLVLSLEFKLPDENQVLLKIPRQNNMYSFNLVNIVPSGGLACLIAKATTDESNKCHRRLGHVNFKNLNKLPSKIFQNDHTCIACQKGKQHKASCKAKSVSSISHSLQLLHMDFFGHTSISDQAKEIQHLKAQIKKLKKQAKPIIKHHRAWMQSVSLKQRLARHRSSKKQWIPEDTLDHMETENAQDVGRTRDIVGEEKENDEIILSTEDVLSTDKGKVSTDKEKVSTDRLIVSTDGSKVSTDRQIEGTDEQIEGTDEQIEGTDKQIEGTDEQIKSTDEQRKGIEDHTKEGSTTQATQTPTSTIFGDDET